MDLSSRNDSLLVYSDMSQNRMGKEGGKQSKHTRISTLGDHVQLLPGIPNEITLDLIAPKLYWKDFYILSRVSPGWKQAIQTGMVFDARVHSHSTETVVALQENGPTNEESGIALYSTRDDCWNELPQIPCFYGGFKSQCVSLEGKIYVLGGAREPMYYSGSRDVYVFDLAGQKQWRQCASMHQPRLNFGAGVFDGKIYVFGGVSLGKLVGGCEVYDPKIDVWSQVKPLTFPRVDHLVSTTKEGLIVHGGTFYDPTSPYGAKFYDIDRTVHPAVLVYTKVPQFYEVYHPGRDEWTLIEPSVENNIVFKAFTVQQKILGMILGYQVCNIDEHLFSLQL